VNGFVEWDGQRLEPARVALYVKCRPEPGLQGRLAPVFAAAAAGERGYFIPVERIGAFLLDHARKEFVCAEAGAVHLALDRQFRRSGEEPARQALWGFARDFRLADVTLLDGLVDLARLGVERPARELEPIALARCGLAIADEMKVLDDRGHAAEARPFDDVRRAAVTVAAAILTVYEALRAEMDAVDEEHDLGGGGAWNGSLILGLLVQGAIAVAHAGSAGGLLLRKDAVDDVLRRCDDLYRSSSHALAGSGPAERCFSWTVVDGRKQVEVDDRGRLRVDKDRLATWLAKEVAASPGLFNTPLRPPMKAPDRVAVLSNRWGDLARPFPLVWAWSTLETAASVKSWAASIRKSGDRTVRSVYDVLPTVMSIRPNLDLSRRLIPELRFEARPGHVLLVANLRDLELRCLARICEGHGGRSKLAELFRAGDDPASYTAAALAFARDSVFEEDRPVRGRYEALLGQDPGLHRWWLALARTLLYAIPRGLSPDHARELFRQDSGEDLVGRGMAGHYRRVKTIIPEFLDLTHDRTLDRVDEVLGIADYEPLSETLPYPETYAVRLRDAIAGRIDDRKLLKDLSERATDPEWKERLSSGVGRPGWEDELFKRTRVTFHGRIRGGHDASHIDAPLLYLDLADDVRKAVLFAVVDAGYDLVACAGDEFVVAASERTPPGPYERAARLRTLAEDVVDCSLVRVIPIFVAPERLVSQASHESRPEFLDARLTNECRETSGLPGFPGSFGLRPPGNWHQSSLGHFPARCTVDVRNDW
jgi:hypothetical protein